MMTVTYRSNRTGRALFGVMGALLLTSVMTRVRGQDPAAARVFGIVTDNISGAVVPGARVVFKDEKSAVERVIVSNDEGIYSALDLNPGTYVVEVVQSGFKKYRRKGMALRAGSRARIDVTLEVGPMTEIVSVEANAPSVTPIQRPDLEAKIALLEKKAELRSVSAAKDQPQLIVQSGYLDGVTSVVFSPDGRLILAGSQDKTARLWEVETGRELRRFDHQDEVESVAFSTDGRIVLTEGKKETRIWDAAAGREVQLFQDGKSPDGRLVLEIQQKRMMIVRESVSAKVAVLRDKAGKELNRFEPYSAPKAFSPDGRFVLERGENKTATLKELATGREVLRLKGHTEEINSLAFSPDGRVIATASGYGTPKDATVRVWDPATGQELRRFDWNSDFVMSVAFSPDGRFIKTEGGSVDLVTGPAGASLSSVYLWDTTTGRQGRNLDKGRLNVTAAAYSPDGRFILTGSWESARLWDTATGGEVQRFERHSSWIRAVAFSSDGRFVLTGSADDTARLWDAATGQEIRRFLGHTNIVSFVAFSPNGRFVLSGGGGTARLWQAATGQELARLEGAPLAFSPDGRFLMYDRDGALSMREAPSGQKIRQFGGNHERVASAGFSADGRLMVTGNYSLSASNDKVIPVRLWDVATGQELRRFLGHTSTVHSVALSPDSRFVLTGSGDILQNIDTTARLWDAASGQELRRYGTESWPVLSVGFSPNGKYVLTKALDVFGADQTGLLGKGVARLWDVTGGKPVRQFGEVSTRRFATVSSDGNLVLMGRSDSTVRLADGTTGDEQRRFEGSVAALSPDGRFVATATKDGTVIVFNAATGREERRFKGESGQAAEDDESADLITALAFSPDSRFVAAGREEVTLWDRVTGQKARRFEGHSAPIDAIDFSPNGRFLLTRSSGNPDSTARLWDVATGKQVKSFEPDSDEHEGNYVALSSDGRLALTCAGFGLENDPVGLRDSEVHLWDTATGKEIRTLVGHSENVLSAAFSPDARLIVTGGLDNTTRLWETSSGEELCRLISFRDGTWVVVDPRGRFDTNNLEEIRGLHWVFPDDPIKSLPLEIFMRDYYEPRLLTRILAGEKFRPVRTLADLNRLQPEVKIAEIEPQENSPGAVSVTVEVSGARGEINRAGKRTILETGVHDLRLFRDGQLVGHAPETGGEREQVPQAGKTDDTGDLESWRQATAIKVDASTGRTAFRFDGIKLPRKGARQVEFSAYAFNVDRVKTATARKIFVPSDELPVVKGRAYLITVGVNAYQSPDWDLMYAANDALRIRKILHEQLARTGEYQEIVAIPLISDYQWQEGKRKVIKQQATKANFKAVLDLLAGKNVDSARMNSIPGAGKIRLARPEDMILISFSSHGYVDGRGNFYFFPYDIGASQGRGITENLLKRCISSEELSSWVRHVDSGEIVMIVDACHSAATIAREGFKPGPMGSRGLGQLAYDKGMRILTASQADDVALESDLIRQGLLTYALIHDGIEAGQADFKPKDMSIGMAEWLEYGVERVPRLYEEVRLGQLKNSGRGPRNVKIIVPGGGQSLKFQQPALFDFAKRKGAAVLAITGK